MPTFEPGGGVPIGLHPTLFRDFRRFITSVWNYRAYAYIW